MADNDKGPYTDEFVRRIDRREAKSMAETYLQRAAPHEIAHARFELERFGKMDDTEKQALLIQYRRGSNWDLLLGLVALAGFYGAGAWTQNWFPYSWQKIPILPTAFGAAAVGSGLMLKQNYGFRAGIALAGAGFALGGASISMGGHQ